MALTILPIVVSVDYSSTYVWISAARVCPAVRTAAAGCAWTYRMIGTDEAIARVGHLGVQGSNFLLGPGNCAVVNRSHAFSLCTVARIVVGTAVDIVGAARCLRKNNRPRLSKSEYVT